MILFCEMYNYFAIILHLWVYFIYKFELRTMRFVYSYLLLYFIRINLSNYMKKEWIRFSEYWMSTRIVTAVGGEAFNFWDLIRSTKCELPLTAPWGDIVYLSVGDLPRRYFPICTSFSSLGPVRNSKLIKYSYTI